MRKYTEKNTLEKTIIISSSEFSKIQDIPVNVELIEATEKLKGQYSGSLHKIV